MCIALERDMEALIVLVDIIKAKVGEFMTESRKKMYLLGIIGSLMDVMRLKNSISGNNQTTFGKVWLSKDALKVKSEHTYWEKIVIQLEFVMEGFVPLPSF